MGIYVGDSERGTKGCSWFSVSFDRRQRRGRSTIWRPPVPALSPHRHSTETM